MASLKNLTASETEMVYEWLRAMGMPVGRKIHRDYSDGVLVAKLMKKLYPRLLETQSYQTHIGYDLKLINWQMLQFKVFSRIGLPLTRRQMHALAVGENGMLEKLLHEVMQIAPKTSTPDLTKAAGDIRRSGSLRRSTKSLYKKTSKKASTETLDASELAIDNAATPTNQRSSTRQSNEKIDKIVDITEQGMVPFAIYEGVINEVRSKENTIKAFKTKVAILERIIQERDSEIQILKHRNR